MNCCGAALGEPGGTAKEQREPSSVRQLTCKEVILQYLNDYLDAALSPEAVSDFERHLQSCAGCRAYRHTYAKTRDVVHHAGQIPMPQEIRAHVRRFLLTQLAKQQP